MNRAVSVDPQVMSGTPVFTGTRVPVRALWDYLEAGDTVDQFLQVFDWVTREQVLAVLEDSYANLVKAE